MKRIINCIIFLFCVFKLFAQIDTRGVNVTAIKDTLVFHGNIYAVIVGVSNYKYVKPLSFADQDALLFRDFLQSKSGGSVKPDNIKLILDEDAKADTYPQINKWLAEKKLQKGDRVYFYFAGHGDAIDADQYFFLLQNCNPAGDPNTYTGGFANVIQMYNLKMDIKNRLIKNGIDVLLIWDACRTNELPGGETGLKNMQEGIAEKSDGESIMLSASAGEVALENSNYAHGHGLFTYYLIDGLSGAADKPENHGNGDGKVDMRELEAYVKWRVSSDANNKFKVAQDPRFIYSGDETLSIVDSDFENEWAMRKISGEDIALNYKNPAKASGRNVQEADSIVIILYNRFMESVKNDSLDSGPNSAEELYSELLKKYPENALTDQAGFNLAMEYINLAQDKINLYLSGKDDMTLLAAPKANNENHNTLDQAQILSSGKNYGRNAQYLYRALELLKKDTISDVNYLKQLQAKADFLSARSYISNEGMVSDFTKAMQLAKTAMSIQPQAAYNYLLFGSLYYINKQYDSSIYYERKALALAPKWVNAFNNLGLAFDAEKDYDSAQFYYRKAIAINPDYLSPYGNLSYNFSSRNIYDSAYKYSHEAIALNPFYTGGYNSLGIIFHFQKKYDSAKIYYQKTISIDPKYAAAYNNLGILFYNETQYDSSKNYYRKTITVDPNYSDAYYNLAIIFNDQKQYDSAMVYYKKTIGINPKYTDAYVGIGTAFWSLKQSDSAAVYYRKALSIDVKSAYAYNNLGVLFFNKKEYDSAKYYYNKAIHIDSKYAQGYSNLGLLYSNKKQYDSAKYFYSKCLQIDSEYINGYFGLGVIFFQEQLYDSARIYYWKVLKIDPKYANVYNGLGNIFMIDKEYDSAGIYYHKAVNMDPKLTDAIYNLGYLFLNLKRYDSANIYYFKALDNDAEYTKAYNGLGNTFMIDKKYDSAGIYFHKTISTDPGFTDGYYNLGFLFYSEKQYDSAEIYFHKAITVDPKYENAYYGLGNTFMIDKKYDSAGIYFHKAVNIDPNFTNGYNDLGLLFLSQKKYDSAKHFYNKCISIDSKYINGYNGLGSAFFYQQLYDSAILNFREVIRLDSLNIVANNFFSACLFLKKEIDSAAYFLEKIIVNKIAYQFTFNVGSNVISGYESKKMYDKELDLARLLYNYDSVYNVPGVDSTYKKSLMYNLGFAYLFKGNHASGKYYYEKAGALSYYYYNIACISSLDKKLNDALENLELSFQKGFHDYDHIQKDTDLDNIRNTDEFKKLLEKYFPDVPGN